MSRVQGAVGGAVTRIWGNWNAFWFAPGDDQLALGLFRFFFGVNAFVMYLWRQINLDLYFTDAGPVAAGRAFEIIDPFFRPAVELHALVAGQPHLWHTLFLGAILLLALGIFGRAAALVALVLHLAFLQRNLSIVYGADIVTAFWLFSLALAENDRDFSLRARWRAARGCSAPAPAGSSLSSSPNPAMRPWSAALTGVSLRLVQIQLCIIYGYTGMEKLKGAPWWDGTAVWAVLGNSQLMVADLSFLKSAPVLVGLMTHSALVWEIYFPVLVWFKPLRKWLLGFGVLLHLGIGFGMGLFFFSGAMVAAYFVFADGETLRRAFAGRRRCQAVDLSRVPVEKRR